MNLVPNTELYAFEPLIEIRINKGNSPLSGCPAKSNIEDVEKDSLDTFLRNVSSSEECVKRKETSPVKQNKSSYVNVQLPGVNVARTKALKRVTFHDKVEIREHAVAIGDHPSCMGGLPLTLDWQHAEEIRTVSLSASCPERQGAYRNPPRLTYEQRKERFKAASVNVSATASSVRGKEIDLGMKILECSWSRYKILPLPKFEAIDDDSSDDDGESSDSEYCNVQPSPEQLSSWTSVLRQSDSFMRR